MSNKIKHKQRSKRSHRNNVLGKHTFYKNSYDRTFDFNKALARWLSSGKAQVIDVSDVASENDSDKE